MKTAENAGEPVMMDIGEGEEARAIAVRHRPTTGKGPGLVWLGGFRSDMEGTKAVELDGLAEALGVACTRHDYSGHGASGGLFTDGTISRWLAESLTVFDTFTAGPQILVGSSMGGWIALRMVRELTRRGEGARVAGLLLLAPAPDFTHELMEPVLTAEQKRDLEEKGYYEEPTPYGPDPNVFTRALFEDGRENRVLDGIVKTGCPVHIIQGMKDADVPYCHALRLVEHLAGDNVVLTLVNDGDHRLSRPQDLERMRAAIVALCAGNRAA